VRPARAPPWRPRGPGGGREPGRPGRRTGRRRGRLRSAAGGVRPRRSPVAGSAAGASRPGGRQFAGPWPHGKRRRRRRPGRLRRSGRGPVRNAFPGPRVPGAAKRPGSAGPLGPVGDGRLHPGPVSRPLRDRPGPGACSPAHPHPRALSRRRFRRQGRGHGPVSAGPGRPAPAGTVDQDALEPAGNLPGRLQAPRRRHGRAPGGSGRRHAGGDFLHHAFRRRPVCSPQRRDHGAGHGARRRPLPHPPRARRRLLRLHQQSRGRGVSGLWRGPGQLRRGAGHGYARPAAWPVAGVPAAAKRPAPG